MVAAHEERPDTIGTVSPDVEPSYMIPVPVGEVDEPHQVVMPDMEFSEAYMSRLSELNKRFSPIKAVRPWKPGVADIASWDGGGFSAVGGMGAMPGLMGVERGVLALYQTFGRLSLNLSATAEKYGYFRGLQTSYGFDASATYRLSDKWSLTLFGGYHSGLSPLNPAMAGYMATSNFGGYVSYDISEHWGVSVGAQTTKSLVTNTWEARPIVMPYYKINDKVAVSADLGGILYELIRSYVDRSDNNGGCPVMGPPVPRAVPLAPRR